MSVIIDASILTIVFIDNNCCCLTEPLPFCTLQSLSWNGSAINMTITLYNDVYVHYILYLQVLWSLSWKGPLPLKCQSFKIYWLLCCVVYLQVLWACPVKAPVSTHHRSSASPPPTPALMTFPTAPLFPQALHHSMTSTVYTCSRLTPP